MNTNQMKLPEYLHNFPVTNSSELVGGTQEKWKQMTTQVGQTIEQSFLTSGGQNMSSLNYDITRLNRMDCPLQLNPHTATFNDIAIHALLRQRLKPSTIDKHLRYARFMETTPYQSISATRASTTSSDTWTTENKSNKQHPTRSSTNGKRCRHSSKPTAYPSEKEQDGTTDHPRHSNHENEYCHSQEPSTNSSTTPTLRIPTKTLSTNISSSTAS